MPPFLKLEEESSHTFKLLRSFFNRNFSGLLLIQVHEANYKVSSFGVLQKVSEISEKNIPFFHAEPAIGKKTASPLRD